MPHIVLTHIKEPDYDRVQKAKIMTFLTKLRDDDTLPGLHIEPMRAAVDPRARTGRVDRGLRAVLYRLDTVDAEAVYVYAGTWPHDEAIERARTRALRVNPINGVAELIEVGGPGAAFQERTMGPPPPEPEIQSGESSRSYGIDDLVQLGFSVDEAERIMRAGSEDSMLAIADSFENQWKVAACLGLAVGDSLAKIKHDLQLNSEPTSTDVDFLESLRLPASRMQFSYVESDDELRQAIEHLDLAAWRIFLHPSQRRIVDLDTAGPYRLTGSAGTGKTVILLHRTRRILHARPGARILLTTFTRALAANLSSDLLQLDSSVEFADSLGQQGVLVRGIDAVATAVREAAGAHFPTAAELVMGGPLRSSSSVGANLDDWRAAARDQQASLPPEIGSPGFLADEYAHVILPNGYMTADAYLAADRSGRAELDTVQRMWVWAIVERYRENCRVSGRLSFADVAEIGARWLEQSGSHLVDHALVDEGQDLGPSHWRLLRALVRPGEDDIFVAEDAHQRIYEAPDAMSRGGLSFSGRSERLTLNYRTTAETLRWAMRVIADETFVDGEGGVESGQGYRSSRHGPEPLLKPAQSIREELDIVARQVGAWLREGVAPGSIAVLVRSNNDAHEVEEALTETGIRCELLSEPGSDAGYPAIVTMHLAKGMEFSRVVLFDLSADALPARWALRGLSPTDRASALLRERALLYVAATRARDQVVVTYRGDLTPLIPPARS